MIPLFEQYTQEFSELNLPYSFDLDIIEEGMTIKLITGEEFVVNSINHDSCNIVLEYADLDGNTLVISPNEAITITEKKRKLFWYDAIKAIIEMDIIKMGASFS